LGAVAAAVGGEVVVVYSFSSFLFFYDTKVHFWTTVSLIAFLQNSFFFAAALQFHSYLQ
jgi:hypothetical protein